MRNAWARRVGMITLVGTMVGFLPTPYSPAIAQVTVYPDQIQFELATGAVLVPIPGSQTAFPGTNCGPGDTGPTGRGQTVEIVFDSNKVIVTGAAGNDLCIFDEGTTINTPNTDPNVMLANTIVANGQDDFLLVFDHPIYAVGFRFLTNREASETVTFKGPAGNTISTENLDALTPPNSRPFVGFKSTTPIKSVTINTAGGSTQNEGFDALKVADTVQVRIDIKPNSSENTINPKAGGVIPTAIFSGTGFDTASVNPATLSLAGAPVKSVAGNNFLCNPQDLNADGRVDMLCHFEVPSGLQQGDSVAVLQGRTFDDTKIRGQDFIRLVPGK